MGYLSKSSGVLTGTGTVRTLSFGKTLNEGRFYALLLAGAVTHSTSFGTKQWTYISGGSAELALYTLSSAGAGVTGVSLTNNGSGYPVHWVLLEYPTGTVYGPGRSDQYADPTSTWNTLTGVTPTVDLVAAFVKTMISTTGNIAATWGAGWSEEYDDYRLNDGSVDGCFLTVASQPDYASSSVTPSLSLTGTFSSNDTQRGVGAFTIPAQPSGMLLTETRGAIALEGGGVLRL